MAERKWGSITSGATFEALATTIVYFEDPKAALFGRRGKDGGQDARSGDGTRVFQAKHHESGSAAAAIRDAKKEATKIEEYRQPGHARHAQWQGVTHWRLVTNATFNPTDKHRWDTEVVPLFTNQGLTADYWERRDLEVRLDKYDEIHRSFFENETRAFLCLPEVKERLPAQEPFLHRDELGPFCGRTEEKAALRTFLASDKLFLVVHGAGGTGKTRFVVDAGDEIAGEGEWQVLWANVESMAATGSWFDAIDTARATMLIVDEPSDESILQQLAEQLGGRVGRTTQWKVVIAVRSPKDPVIRFLGGARMKHRVQPLPLSPLPEADAEEMAFKLMSTGRRAGWPDEAKRDAARQLSRRFSSYPVWLTLAIQHVEDHGDLKKVPESAETLADEYLLEIEQANPNANAEEIRTLLRWVALVGTVNREDDTAVKFIGEPCGLTSLVEVRARLAGLVQRRALTERGARNRFIELKPDVLRDHVLRRWLSRDVGADRLEVSDEGKQLLQAILASAEQGMLSPLGQAILTSLARTEFLLRLAGHEVGLLETFFGGLEQAVPTMKASQRLTLPRVIEAIAHFHPCAATSLVRAFRTHPTADETIEGIFGPKVVRHVDVVLALAWPLFGAAMGAQTEQERYCVLRELSELAKEEADITTDEHALLRRSCDLFTRTGRTVQLVAALALSVRYEWTALRPVLEEVLQNVPSDQRPDAAHALVNAIYWAVQEGGPTPPPKDLAEWLLTQLLALPDFDDLGGNEEWHLAEIIKRLGAVELRWLPGALLRRQQQENEAEDARHARAISRNPRISKFVKTIVGDDSTSPVVLKAVGQILELTKDNGSVGYYLPEVLRDIDPQGLVVPDEVAARASSALDAEDVRRLARIAGAYVSNSPPWRAIALATIRSASRIGSDALRSVYGALGDRGIRSWSALPHEVAPIFFAAVDDARRTLDAETHQELRPYWQQRLADVEAELREEEQRVKEERGE